MILLKDCDLLSYLNDNILIRFGTIYTDKLMVTKCALIIADLFVVVLFYYYFFFFFFFFVMSFSDDSQLILLRILTQVSEYLDNLLNIDNTFDEGMVTQVYHNELQLKT